MPYPEEIALGFYQNLYRLKSIVPQAENFEDMGLDPWTDTRVFATELLVRMRAARSIHFDLTDMRYLTGMDGVITGPAEINALGSTNWELRTIWDDPDLFAKTTFYKDGEVVLREDLTNVISRS